MVLDNGNYALVFLARFVQKGGATKLSTALTNALTPI